MKCIVTLIHYCSPYNSPPPLGGFTFRIKKRNFSFFMKTTLSYLSYRTGLRRKRGLDWRHMPVSRSQSFTAHLYLCMCVWACVFAWVWERQEECVWVLRARCHQKHTISLGTTAKQDFQAHLISSALRCDIVIFFLRKFSQKNSIKNIFMYFHKIAFKWTCLHTGWI